MTLPLWATMLVASAGVFIGGWCEWFLSGMEGGHRPYIAWQHITVTLAMWALFAVPIVYAFIQVLAWAFTYLV